MSRQTQIAVLPHLVRFLHYRACDDQLRNDTNKLGINARTGACVAFIDNEEGAHHAGEGFIVVPEKQIAYAVSFCHPNDNYNKRLGRIKAFGRLKSAEYLEVSHATTKREFLGLIDAEMESYGYVRKYSSGAPAADGTPAKHEAKHERVVAVTMEPKVASDV